LHEFLCCFGVIPEVRRTRLGLDGVNMAVFARNVQAVYRLKLSLEETHVHSTS